jgi:hypothetical protein
MPRWRGAGAQPGKPDNFANSEPTLGVSDRIHHRDGQIDGCDPGSAATSRTHRRALPLEAQSAAENIELK